MTTVEFVAKCLNKAKVSLETQKRRKGVSEKEICDLEEKVKHYQEILRMHTELEITRAYIDKEDLEWDLLLYAKERMTSDAK